MIRRWLLILCIFIGIVVLRVFFAMQTPYFSSDQAYFYEQVVDRISSGQVFWNDSLGYGGRFVLISPVFEFLLAFAGLFFPIELVLKVLPNIFAGLLVLPAFLLAFRLTNNDSISFAASLLASIVPVFIAKTFNQISPLSLAIPLFFLLIYAWLSERIYLFLALLILFAFIHPLSIVLVLSIGVYFILSGIDRFPVNVVEYELGIFSIFFTLWVHFLLFKKLIVFHGPLIIWRNIPAPLLSSFFTRITLIGAIVQIGIYPVVQGIYAVYKTVLSHPSRDVNMLFAVVLTSGILLWLKIIDLSSGMMLLGVTLAILFSRWSLSAFQYLKQTRISHFAGIIIIGSVCLALLTTAYPAYAAINSELSHTIMPDEVNALSWLKEQTPVDATVIAPVDYGHYVESLGSRSTVIDEYFFLQSRISERYEDVKRIYVTAFETEAVELFNKYNATHLLIPPGVKDISYAKSPCFKRIYSQDVLIYAKDSGCKLKVVK